MLFLFLLEILGSSFNVINNGRQNLHLTQNGAKPQFHIQNSNIIKAQSNKKAKGSNCNLAGLDFIQSDLDISYCKAIVLSNISFNLQNGEMILRLSYSDNVEITNCDFVCGTEAPESTLIEIINTNVDIKSFDFDFSNLSTTQYLISPIFSFTSLASDGDQLKLFQSQISISVKDLQIQSEGIIYSNNYKLEVSDTLIDTVKIQDTSKEIFIIKIDHSDDIKTGCYVSIDNSTFSEISTSKFIISATDSIQIHNSIFENIGDSLFMINGGSEISFDNTTFSNSNGDENICPINTNKWSTTNNNFHLCTFEEITGTAVIINGNGIYTFTDCEFINNTNDKINSAAIYAKGESTLTITSCNFIKNVGKSQGGALLIDVTTVEISYCIFNENTCNKDESIYDSKGTGGALYLVQNTNLNISYCTFSSNHASDCGGGVFIRYRKSQLGRPNTDIILINHCIFDKCTADDYGGAFTSGTAGVQQANNDGDIIIFNCSFIDCKAKNYGGALMFQDGSHTGDEFKTIINCTFDHCYIDQTYEGQGLCIYSLAYSFSLTDSIFQNYGTGGSFGQGSMIYLEMNEDIPGINDPLIDNCTFIVNSEYTFATNVKGTLNVRNSLFYPSPDSYCINLLDLKYMNTGGRGNVFENCIFQNNIGTAVIGEKYKHVFINCTFMNNTYKYQQNSACLRTTYRSQYTLLNCSFLNNVGSGNGGAVYAESINIDEFSDLKFINNSLVDVDSLTQNNGGALCLYQTEVDENNPADIPKIITIKNCYFENNYAKISGGGIFVNFRDVINTTQKYYNIPVIINECTFINCSSKMYGGAISSGIKEKATQSPYHTGDITINECTFKDCYSQNGGAIFSHDGSLEGDEETNISCCTFDHCSGIRGGCVCSLSYKIVLENSTFANNADDYQSESDTTNPGFNTNVHSFLYLDMNEKEINPIINNCIFINNDLCTIFTEIKGTLTMLDCTFTNYSSKHLLDVSYINSIGSIQGTIYDGCKFQYSYTDTAVFGNKYNHTFTKCTFLDNHKSGNNEGPGALLINNDGYFSLSNCSFVNNIGLAKGGAIMFNIKNIVSFDDIQFIGNSINETVIASHDPDSGGAIYIDQNIKDNWNPVPFSIRNCYFKDNFLKADASLGGAIFIQFVSNDYLAHYSPFTIESCTFIGCTSFDRGGAIASGSADWHKSEDTGDLIVNYCNFTDC